MLNFHSLSSVQTLENFPVHSFCGCSRHNLCYYGCWSFQQIDWDFAEGNTCCFFWTVKDEYKVRSLFNISYFVCSLLLESVGHKLTSPGASSPNPVCVLWHPWPLLKFWLALLSIRVRLFTFRTVLKSLLPPLLFLGSVESCFYLSLFCQDSGFFTCGQFLMAT